MTKKSDDKYFNFPIQLLDGFIPETSEVLKNIWNYSLYKMTLSYEEGDEDDKIKSAMSFFEVRSSADATSIYEEGELLYNSLPSNSPMVGMKISMYFDYYKNDKTDFQKACLLGFLAIKSILQNKSYCKMDNQFWLSRMDGNTKSIKTEFLSQSISKFSNHYQTRKIKDELVDGWNLKTYSHYTRGFYVSFKMDWEPLIFEAEKKRKSTKKKQLDELKKNARLDALKRLKDRDNES